MSGQMLLLNLGGAVALLVWATRLVRTGILRAFGERLRSIIGGATRNRLLACLAGMGVATALQSSAATGLVLTSFAERGLIMLGPALAVMLGADIGSSLVVQALAFKLHGLVPFLLMLGVVVFMAAEAAIWRHLGRIVIGLALMLLSLRMIGSASEPLREDAVLALVLQHLGDQPLLAVLVGAGLTWLAHSSVAMILFFISLAAGGVLGPVLALQLVLGANIGSGLVPLGLAARSGIAARRVLVGNLGFRVIGALAALVAVGPAAAFLAEMDGGVARQIAHAHTAFNIVLALAFLPLTGLAAALIARLMPDPATPTAERRLVHLDLDALDRPAIALSGASREVLRLADTVEVMLRDAILPFAESDGHRREEIKRLDTEVDKLQDEIKIYLTRLTRRTLSEAEARQAFDLILFTTNLEHVGDIIDKNLLALAGKKQRLHLSFSPEGWGELTRMHALAVEQMRLAVTVFVTRDADMARDLVRAKENVRAIERQATESHLRRLRDGAVASIETSSLHIDMLRDLKRIIAHLTTVAHPILEASGELRDSRLRQGRERPRQKSANAPAALPR
jgi:phosphate:Na+ symporter